MGVFSQFFRGLKNSIKGLFQRKPKRNSGEPEVIKVPRSWQKQKDQPVAGRAARTSAGNIQPQAVIRYKRRIPGLRVFKRFLCGFLLLINFTFSQFLLGTIGSQAQPMFLLFLLNSFFLLDYLWKTRRKPE